MVLVTMLLVVVTIPMATDAAMNILEKRRLKSLSIYCCRARSFDPRLIVNAFGVHNFYEYWPITADVEIDDALSEHCNVLLVGRPHVGKSRAAAHHIKKHFGQRWALSTWWVLRPLPYCVDNVEKVRIRKRRYVLLLDDVDNYLSIDTTGVGVLQLVQHLQQQAKELVVVATVRRTLPEFETLESNPRLLGRWRQVEIHDWPYNMCAELASALGTDPSAWDGTPLSVIQPSSLMAGRYRGATPEEKRALHALKLCADCGLVFVPRELLIQICKLAQLGRASDAGVNEATIQSLYDNGFLQRTGDSVQSFPAYLQMISDWDVTPPMRAALKTTLITGSWTRQLAAFGRARARAGDLIEAREAHEATVHLEPKTSAYHYNLGVVLSRLHLWHEAAESLQHAATLDPRRAIAHYRLARALREEGKIEESVEAFRKARLIGSGDPDVHYQIGELLRLAGRTDDAIGEFREVIQLDPNNASAWQAYGRALREQAKWQDAAAAHRRAIECKPDLAEAYFGLAEPLFELGDLDGAEKMYRKAIDLRPNLAEAYCYLSRLLERKGRRQEAESVLRRAAEECPKDARVHSYLGQLLGSTKRNADALVEFTIATELKPSYAEARVGLAMQQRILGRKDAHLCDEAIRNNRIALELDPEIDSAYYGLGMCYLNKKDWGAAEKYFHEATRQNPTMGPAWFHRALAIRYGGGTREEVLRCLQEAEHSGYDKTKVAHQRLKLLGE